MILLVESSSATQILMGTAGFPARPVGGDMEFASEGIGSSVALWGRRLQPGSADGNGNSMIELGICAW